MSRTVPCLLFRTRRRGGGALRMRSRRVCSDSRPKRMRRPHQRSTDDPRPDRAILQYETDESDGHQSHAVTQSGKHIASQPVHSVVVAGQSLSF